MSAAKYIRGFQITRVVVAGSRISGIEGKVDDCRLIQQGQGIFALWIDDSDGVLY